MMRKLASIVSYSVFILYLTFFVGSFVLLAEEVEDSIRTTSALSKTSEDILVEDLAGEVASSGGETTSEKTDVPSSENEISFDEVVSMLGQSLVRFKEVVENGSSNTDAFIADESTEDVSGAVETEVVGGAGNDRSVPALSQETSVGEPVLSEEDDRNTTSDSAVASTTTAEPPPPLSMYVEDNLVGAYEREYTGGAYTSPVRLSASQSRLLYLLALASALTGTLLIVSSMPKKRNVTSRVSFNKTVLEVRALNN
jgi:hypothetical protein